MVWDGVGWYKMVRIVMRWYDMVRHGLRWYVMVWDGVEQCETV